MELEGNLVKPTMYAVCEKSVNPARPSSRRIRAAQQTKCENSEMKIEVPEYCQNYWSYENGLEAFKSCLVKVLWWVS